MGRDGEEISIESVESVVPEIEGKVLIIS